MISRTLKPVVTRLINPVARLAIRLGLSPDFVTLTGAVGVIASATFFYLQESYFWGTMAVTIFVLSDLFDGAIARLSQRGPSLWGGFLDSTVDRITDSVVIISISIPLIRAQDKLSYLALTTLVTGFLIPYLRAKAESFDIACTVGVAERTERLVIILVAVGLHGLHLPYALALGFWLLSILGAITVLQRLALIFRELQER